jgi:hypothetical protein
MSIFKFFKKKKKDPPKPEIELVKEIRKQNQ